MSTAPIELSDTDIALMRQLPINVAQRAGVSGDKRQSQWIARMQRAGLVSVRVIDSEHATLGFASARVDLTLDGMVRLRAADSSRGGRR
jgi:hypothetical protein